MFKIGKIGDIDIKITAGFIGMFIMLGALGFPQAYKSDSMLVPYLLGLLTTFSLYAVVFVHEFGHIFAAAHYGRKTDQITMFMFGMGATIPTISKKPSEEFIIGIAGPLVNVIFVGLLLGLDVIFDFQKGTNIHTYMNTMYSINIIIAIFNMLPIFPMDGGRCLMSILWAITRKPVISCQISLVVAGIVAALVACWFASGGYWFSVMVMGFVGLMVWVHWEKYPDEIRRTLNPQPPRLMPEGTYSKWPRKSWLDEMDLKDPYPSSSRLDWANDNEDGVWRKK